MTNRVVLNFMAIILITLALSECVFAVTLRTYYYQNISRMIITHADTSQDLFNRFNQENPSEENGKLLSSILKSFDTRKAELQVLNTNGDVLTSSSGFEVNQKVHLKPEILSGKKVIDVAKMPDTGEKVMNIYVPIQIYSGTYVLRYITSLEDVDDVLTLVYAGAATIGIIIALIVFIISLRFARSIVDPITNIISAAKEMAKGHFNIRVDKKYKNELGELADTLNYMADEIVKTNKLKSEFISSISHELRTPLTGIKGWSETMLLSRELDRKDFEEGLNIIASETNRLIELVEDLLDFSRLQSNTLKLYKDNFRFDELLKEVVKSLKIKAKEKNIKIEIHQLKRTVIHGDKNRLKQVIINTIDNAIKFSRPNSTIDIFLKDSYEYITLIVKDYGIGISEEHLPYLTQSFYQVSSKGQGSGLGLSITKQIIDLHKGKIDIKSKVNEGTTISIQLPKLILENK
ncbi:signal transduction histidine kinase [Scopulibacillus daqui]|uniref:histidine kinase n=2 Tax=Scopulibacillus daqui TaxID=1469162 RepID=A0ABS2Q0C8_9BACL|nr:signal transduction histidine kinase [Scopulibacillus daqui]